MFPLKRSLASLILCALSYGSYARDMVNAPVPAFDYQQISSSIQTHLERHLYQLPPRVLGHYGIRMYRMTGDEKYANAALTDLYVVSSTQAFYACQLNDKQFVTAQAQQAIDKLGKGPRAKARKKALAPFPEFLFYTDILLRTSSRIDEFGLEGPCHDQLLAGLKASDLKQGLTDPAMIKAWAAQLINYAYWAKQIGVGDYIEQYKQAFNAVYPANQDKQLSKAQFRNKLYGMTHFIFADSQYYQRSVDAEKFAWILSYFEANIDRILTDATADIITEVGISFLLAGQENNPVVDKTKAAISAQYNAEYQVIPSPRGNPDLAMGEHRNVLAIMLFNWPKTLHKGPLLGELSATKHLLPKQVSVLQSPQ
ncbi:DUF3541 domain-containing protein [Shewanella sp. NIFS-20-20]|nr:DUF3541 domain-containing protein [Shewanella sp. NIFS-20-20]MBV7315717.1 DUF3541 domain-containing protein [Shewanella sp. NIFS-20-20]